MTLRDLARERDPQAQIDWRCQVFGWACVAFLLICAAVAEWVL